MIPGRCGLVALAGLLILPACGETYVDGDAAATTDATADETTAESDTAAGSSVALDAPTDRLLHELERLLFDLDGIIVDDEVAARDRLDEIERIWHEVEARLRADDPDDVFNFEQAIELARTGVERRRPADASKGSKILTDVVDAYSSR